MNSEYAAILPRRVIFRSYLTYVYHWFIKFSIKIESVYSY